MTRRERAISFKLFKEILARYKWARSGLFSVTPELWTSIRKPSRRRVVKETDIFVALPSSLRYDATGARRSRKVRDNYVTPTPGVASRWILRLGLAGTLALPNHKGTRNFL